MPIEPVNGTELTYYLLAYDKDGSERREGKDEFLSERLERDLSSGTVTDIFMFSHGWKGDVPAARDQYGRWVKVMADQKDDIASVKQIRPAFKPLLIGLHWPSLPWGDEEVGPASFGIAMPPTVGSPASGAAEDLLERLVEEYAERLADSPQARSALRTIFAAAATAIAPATLPPEVVTAYETLNREAGLREGGEAAAPGHDREPFDAEGAYQRTRDEEALAFGGFGLGGLLGPLRQLSFWKMKDRARVFGETGGHRLLKRLQARTDIAVRFHLMGHSFGCIVASSLLSGPDGKGILPRPVDSLALVQGALSLWSYCSAVPSSPDTPGYFRSIIDGRRVRGTFFTTQSESDTAVGQLYPWAAGIARQVNFPAGAQLPKYGAIGTFGVRGAGCEVVNRSMADPQGANGFEAGKIYNLDGSVYISGGTGISGSHSNIDRPEVAHAVWEAVLRS